ncbi:hypothetical protein [Streptosporangium vulgare]|uniref:Uncharacterized protein n=1 Tax=Streptosporangium vulgare TaxID=46190 RepID=A0ABV5TU79_9ACTN
MRVLETLSAHPGIILLCGLIYILICRWLNWLTDRNRQQARSRQIELALLNTRSEHREAIVRACLEEDRTP